ncbi:MAG TPA: LytTR family transcriptional regulator DNA-binding domain-containing protein [Chitinophagales bacterium]|nr:LytTR family transcriptional regulator DNA-binding domain-containing protein [Chitinophagales bacterium]
MIKAVIIDDEPLARSIVRDYLQSFSQVEISAECNDGFEGVKAVQENKPDLIFLDIQMPKINGFEMLELIEQPPAVIFTTAYDEFAIRAFEANAVDYLLKPLNQERFNNAVKKFLNQHETSSPKKSAQQLLETISQTPPQNQRIVVKIGSRIKIIPLQDVHYIEAADDYVNVVTSEGSFLKNKTMNFFEKNLDVQQFVRTHRSYIVNVQQITRIDAYEKESHLAILQSGKQIPVSKSGYFNLKEVLGV